jgi:hypothetical protein
MIIGIGAAIGMLYALHRPGPSTAVAAPPEPAARALNAQPPEEAPLPKTIKSDAGQLPRPTNAGGLHEASVPAPINRMPKPGNARPITLSKAVDIMVSPAASFRQKRAAWAQLQDAGLAGQLIAELKDRATIDPKDPEIPTALGEAYLGELQDLTDLSQIGDLARQADQSFDAALSLDPNNWDAQFAKASALAGWPGELGQGAEVIERFTALIDQQEAMPQRSDFAQSYILLGDQYLKEGDADSADLVWQEGAEQFPNNTALQTRLFESVIQ